jgi:hypothetical protein
MKWSDVARLRGRVKPDGITIYPVERLGNQLFIYAAGLSQARRLGVPLYVNRGFYQLGGPEKLYLKSYDLDRFDSDLLVPEEDDFHQPIIYGDPQSKQGRFWYNHLASKFPAAVAPVFREQAFTFDARIDRIERGTTLSGYFQSWKYFAGVAEEVRERILRPLNPSEWYLSTRETITPGSGSIILNVRLGDYLVPRHFVHHGLVSREYYVRALGNLRRLGMDGPVYVASDSLQMAMTLLEGIADLVPIAPPPDVNPFDVLQLLARFDGLVAANSAFSWWAGFLGEKPGHVVIAPRPWFTSGIDTRDLLPASWLSLDREQQWTP